MSTDCLFTRQVVALEAIAAALNNGACLSGPKGPNTDQAPADDKPKRTRRTKAQIAADKAAEAEATNGAPGGTPTPVQSTAGDANTEDAGETQQADATAAEQPAPSKPAEPEPKPEKPMDAKAFKSALLQLGRDSGRDDFTDVLRVVLTRHDFKSTQEVTEDLRATILAEAPDELLNHPPIVKEEEI